LSVHEGKRGCNEIDRTETSVALAYLRDRFVAVAVAVAAAGGGGDLVENGVGEGHVGEEDVSDVDEGVLVIVLVAVLEEELVVVL